MPRLGNDPSMETHGIADASKFKFSAVRLDDLGAPEYTLVDIQVDVTGSVYYFSDALRDSLIAAIEACKRSPRSDNLLVRVCLFSTSQPNGVLELHGYKPLAEIDPHSDYPKLQPGGGTPLFDASFSAVGAMTTYARQLTDDDFLVNGIVFVITDGDDNASSSTPRMIKDAADRAIRDESMESLVSVLVGINVTDCRNWLDTFATDAGFTHFVDAGDATPGRLAKLAAFVSQSISSQSQALGTGGPSQAISATI